MNVWCGGCFKQSPTDPFPRQQGVDLEDKSEVLTDNWDKDRYRMGRGRDHLMGVPFECNLCHFRNMNRRDPVWRSAKDMDTIEAIRRVLLDVFWAREEGTVSGNLSRMRRDYLDVQARYSIGDQLLPHFPTHELRDRVGMSAAITMLTSSLRMGDYGPNIQWGTARKTRTWIKNVTNAGVGHVGTPVAGRGRKEARFESGSVTDGEWFYRFAMGMR